MEDARIDNEQIVGAGIDLPRSRRPGSPMESAVPNATGAHWKTVEPQPVTGEVLKRSDLVQLTPVFGTAQPPHGLSGVLRRRAYAVPEHKPRHWALLLLADKVDVVESALAESVQRRPVAVLAGVALIAGAVVALAVSGGRRQTPWRRLIRA
jgi:hypothetical protein